MKKLPINVQTAILSEHLLSYDIIVYNYFCYIFAIYSLQLYLMLFDRNC